MIEENLISGCLQFEDKLNQIIDLVKPQHFNGKNRVIFEAILKVYEAKQEVNLLSVSQKLKEQKINLDLELTEILSKQWPTNIQANCLKLVEENVKNQLNHLALKIVNVVKEPNLDPFEYITSIETELTEMVQGIVKTDLKAIRELKNDLIEETTKIIKEGLKTGLKCGIEALNRSTNGWQKGNLIILAGRPGMGKSSAALDFCLTPALNGTPTAFFSLEMSANEIAARTCSILTNINAQNIVNKNLSVDELTYIINNTGQLDKAPLFIDTKVPLSLSDLRNKARKIKREKGIELIVVDYLQLMSTDNSGSREQDISKLSRGLKLLAKEIDLPIIVLSQLSRKSEERADKKPILSDLRDSGAIEQDADIVIFCHRPEYYGLNFYQIGDNEYNSEGLFIFNIAKFRNGRTGDIKARWVGDLTMVTNYN